jgi:FkbM family methyltransferase
VDYFRTDVIELGYRGHAYSVPQGGLFFDDEEAIRQAHWLVEPGDVVLDLGAGFGSYTLPALACGARVYAIDSNKGALDTLLKAALMNGFKAITTLWMAVYDGGHTVPLALKRQHKHSEHSPPKGVHWATLDGLVAGGVIDEGRVDWIKIDVEGLELGVLQGGIELLKEHHPKLIIEDHSKVYEWVSRMRITSKIVDLLHGLGYHIEVVPYDAAGTPERDYLIAT